MYVCVCVRVVLYGVDVDDDADNDGRKRAMRSYCSFAVNHAPFVFYYYRMPTIYGFRLIC